MTPEPEIKAMSKARRDTLFKILLGIFLVALPFFIFYTTGYRISFEDEGARVVTTGGIYVTTDELDVEVYLDEEQVTRPRLFRNAYYIQNIAAGQHRVVVQGNDVQTWVKELPVDAHIVTEVAAFNMPLETIIRPIPEFFTMTNEAVFFGASTTTEPFPGTTSTVPYRVRTVTATSSLERNSEYDFVVSLFATSTPTSTVPLRARLEEEMPMFAATATSSVATTSTSTIPEFIERSDMRLLEQGDELYAVWGGSVNDTPHYFCVTTAASSSIAIRYGQHIADQVEAERITITDPLLIDGIRFCRSRIRIDRKWQDVQYFNFFPGSSDLVVLQLEDGIYVTEIDDRAWQNTQQIYQGDDITTVVTDDAVFVEREGRYFELLTELPE